MLLMVVERITGRIWHSINRFAESNNNSIKDYIRIKNRPILNIGM